MAHRVAAAAIHLRRRRRPKASRFARGGHYLLAIGEGCPQFSSYAEGMTNKTVAIAVDRHDKYAEGKARPRGGDLLRRPFHGDRFRIAGIPTQMAVTVTRNKIIRVVTSKTPTKGGKVCGHGLRPGISPGGGGTSHVSDGSGPGALDTALINRAGSARSESS